MLSQQIQRKRNAYLLCIGLGLIFEIASLVILPFCCMTWQIVTFVILEIVSIAFFALAIIIRIQMRKMLYSQILAAHHNHPPNTIVVVQGQPGGYQSEYVQPGAQYGYQPVSYAPPNDFSSPQPAPYKD